MPTVQTATGPVDVAALGKTLMHEHIFSFHSDMDHDYPWKEQETYVDSAMEKLKLLKAYDFATVVDLTPIGLGRDVRRVARVAEAAQTNVIVATGIYAKCCMPIYFRRHVDEYGLDFMVDFFVREITQGIGETGIRAGAIKCVTDRQGLTTDVEEMLRASARANVQTGTPILTHSDAPGESGLLQQRIFRQEGVDLETTVIGHCDDSTDIAYLERLINAGSYIGMDRFGDYKMTSMERKLSTIVTLCDAGYASRIVLSHDMNCGGDMHPEASLKNWFFGHIPQVVIPALRERGVSQENLDLMLAGNPKRIFAKASA